MKKYRLSVFMLIIISLLIFGACDAKGRLNDKETAGLYDEVKAAFETGEIWEYRILPSGQVNAACESVGDVTEADIAFIKALSGAVFDEANQLDKYGLWTESKRACRTCVINCSIPAEYDGKSCIAEEFSVTKTDNDQYTVTVGYRFPETSDSGRQKVVIRFEP